MIWVLLLAEGTQASDAAKHLDPASGRAGGAQGIAGLGRVVHITTSGLVYLKKQGIAQTTEGIDFSFDRFTGHAVGAEYNSDSGDVVLQSALTFSGLDNGRPIAMTASHGALDHAQNIAEFSNARYSSAGEVARADVARLYMRADGSVARIVGERHVSLEEIADGSVTADLADAALDAKSKPETAVFTGDVHFAENQPLRQAHGDSERANVRFDEKGHIDHALLEGKVRTSEVARRSGDVSGGASQRAMEADILELWLAAEGAGGKPLLRDVKASGSARMSSVAPDAKGRRTTSTKLAGDTLLAHMVAKNGVAELSTVHGIGHTLVQQVSAKNGDQKSAGETLDAVFRPGGKGNGDVELASATQQGDVVIDRSIPAKPAAPGAAPTSPGVQHATAATAAFDADTDRLTLTGDVRMRDAESQISAARVVMEQDTGDASAEGSVKVSYQHADSRAEASEPVHVLAARAQLNHDAGQATFYGKTTGGGATLARMWQAGSGGQGGSQIEAPVLVFEQDEKRLTARAEAPDVMGSVHAVLASATAAKGAGSEDPVAIKATTSGVAKPLHEGVARITSSLLVYSDLKRQAEFTGGVRVLDQDGEMRAQQATVFLTSANEGKNPKVRSSAGGDASGSASSLTGLFGGSVERIVATQKVEITQPGRKATGERLVYTASDQMFLLTGTAAAPPKVVDATQGTTTGAMLRFHSGDENVVVSGDVGEGPAQRVRTETTVKSEGNRSTGSAGKTGSRGRGAKSQGTGVKQN